MSRNLVIAAVVVVFHVVALWAMQSGLLRRVVEIVVPAEIVLEFLAPPAPKVQPQPPAPHKPKPVKQPTPKATEPLPLATADPTPSTHAPTGVIAPVAPAPPMAAQVKDAPPAAARVQLPSSDADYLQNPKPAYPSMSKRLGEQGQVVVRVLIDAYGKAQTADINQSSGFDRLDQAALNTVLRWRYVPGKHAGVAQTMWFNVPINFVLE
jgi:protein TonB